MISNFASFLANHCFYECNRVAHAVAAIGFMELTGFGKFRLYDLVAGDIAVPEV